MARFLALGYLASAVMMLLLWFWQKRSGRAEIIDIGWVFGIVGLTCLAAFSQPEHQPKQILVATLYLLWGLRLGSHLLTRYFGTGREDPRYAFLRQAWGSTASNRFFWLFQFEALLIPMLAWPSYLASSGSAPSIDKWALAGSLTWLVGIIGETVADRQLKGFKKKETGEKVCQDGLWRYSRHPNYFFEWLIWVGFAITAIPSAWGWTGLAAPVAMWVFLRWVTGVPVSEAQAIRSRGEAYLAYQKTTSPFLPLPPRRSS